jgi:hypothetical protein
MPHAHAVAQSACAWDTIEVRPAVAIDKRRTAGPQGACQLLDVGLAESGIHERLCDVSALEVDNGIDAIGLGEHVCAKARVEYPRGG